MESCSRFTAAEGGARLAAAASAGNILVTEYTAFIPMNLLIEHAYKIRGTLSSGKQRSVYLTRPSRTECVAHEFNILTGLIVCRANKYSDVADWNEEVEVKELLVCTSQVLNQILEEGILGIANINVLIIDSCHLIFQDVHLQNIMKLYKECELERPRILALTYPLFTAPKDENDKTEATEDTTSTDSISDDAQTNEQKHQNNKDVKEEKINEKESKEEIHEKEDKTNEETKVKNEKSEIGAYQNLDDFEMYEKLEWRIEELEKALCCKMDLAEDIDGGKRLAAIVAKPKEYLIEYETQLPIEKRPETYQELEMFMRDTISDAMNFIEEHRYDPTEIYGEDLYEEFMNIPDPTIDPKQLFKEFLYVLDQLGPYAADKAAFTLLIKLEKLKIKVPYERHFLLLCLCTSVFVKIRSYLDSVFSKYESDWEKITLFSTPKVLRFAEILEQFKPVDDKNIDNKCSQIINDVKDANKQNIDESNIVNNINTDDSNVQNDDKTSIEKANDDKTNIENVNEDKTNVKDVNDDKTNVKDINDDKTNVNDDKRNVKDVNYDKTNIDNVNDDKTNTENETNIDDVDENKTNTENVNENNTNLKDINDDKTSTDDANDKTNSENVTENKIDIKAVHDDETNTEDVNDKTNTNTIKRSKTNEMLNAIDSCDFITLGNKIEDRVNTYEANLKDLDDYRSNEDAFSKNKNIENVETKTKVTEDSVDFTGEEVKNEADECKDEKLESESQVKVGKEENTIDIKKEICDQNDTDNKNDLKNTTESQRSFGKRSHRTRGRGRVQRSNAAKIRQMQQNSDALCGIVFMKEALIAKIMFMMIVDMSRSRPALSQLCAQYCAAEPNGLSQEARESQRQGRKQEDVLKKFRMHECNLLLATPALEEGIDLPRCNLVVRWDIPPSYRSHGLCRGRARAPRSTVTLLADAEAHSKELIHNLAIYRELDQIITRKCGCGIQNEPPQEEEIHADEVTHMIKPYTPLRLDKLNKIKSVNSIEAVKVEHSTKDNVNSEINNIRNDTNEINIEIRNDDTTRELIFDNEKDEFKEIQPPDPLRNFNDTIENYNSNDNIPIVNNDLSDSANNNDNKVLQDDRNSLNNYKKIKYDLCSKNRNDKTVDSIASVDLSSAIALINRYCGKLPSDTFTRLAPQWWLEKVVLPDRVGRMRPAYICTLRMPLNCPVKYNIVGHPMPTRVLARRMVALQACRILHKSGELDNQLMPIGKENFKAAELDNDNNDLNDSDCARPGTTKRRQYYFKRTAWAFTDCQPIIDFTDKEIEDNPTPTLEDISKSRNTAWAIAARLWCALPERYNTRGRKLHAPQLAKQALGIMVAKREPQQLQIPAFPVYTRSGEVRVSVEPALEADVRLSPRRAKLIRRFMRFVFADVLRVRRRGMRLHADAAPHNNYYVVPTTKRTKEDGTTVVDIDWEFLELIFKHTEDQKNQEVDKPMIWEESEKKDKEKHKDKEKVKNIENPLLKPGEVFEFDAEKYKDAVVTPWYRNQDQPQFFLVAEICWNLSPESEFPSTQHGSFRSYYKAKYGAELTQPAQPLLDVDHTSARLNLLTPRYVNRKGVALPVSSERTRRNKRDRLDQKQILVPELCRRHPFAAPLWFATVALPCVLYRINALLIADEIRRSVAIDVGLGIPRIDDTTCPGFQWPPLDFGWSLAEVLNTDTDKDKKKDDEKIEEKEGDNKQDEEGKDQKETEEGEEVKEKTLNDILQEKEEAESGFEIGMWSNEMASSIPETVDFDEFMEPLPSNLTFCTSASGGANWAEPVEKPRSQFNPSRAYSVADSDYSYISSDFDTDDSDFNTDGSDEDTDMSGFYSGKISCAAMGVRIEYKTAHEAEAVDLEKRKPIAPAPLADKEDDEKDMALFRNILKEGVPPDEHLKKFRSSVAQHEKEIALNNLIPQDKPIVDLLPEIYSNDKRSDKQNKIDDNKNNCNNDNKLNVNENSSIIRIENKTTELDNKTKDIENEIKDVDNKTKEIENDIRGVENGTKGVENKIKEVDDKTKGVENNTKEVDNKTKEIENEIKEIENKTKVIDSKTIEIENKIKEIDNNKNDVNIESNIHENILNGTDMKVLEEIFPYNGIHVYEHMPLEEIEKNKRILLEVIKKSLPEEEVKKMNCFSMKDINIDSPEYVNEKVENVGFDSKDKYQEVVNSWTDKNEYKPYYMNGKAQNGKEFDFDYQPDLKGHPGPSPSVILQALTMSNANDGINLERLETIGDSFLKFAITAYLYCAHPAVHEGKLSHMRSKQVSNLNLYRLGRNKRLGARMIASKFEPHDNWLPPCHKPPPTLQTNTGDQKDPLVNLDVPFDNSGCFIPYNLITQHSIPDKSIADCVEALIGAYLLECGPRGALLFMSWLGIRVLPQHLLPLPPDHPYVLQASCEEQSTTTQKTVKSRVTETISSDSEWSSEEGGAEEEVDDEGNELQHDWGWPGRPVGGLRPYRDQRGQWVQPVFGELKAPPSPLLRYIDDPEGELERMLSGYEQLEGVLRYRFRDRALLLQALTHASHAPNRLTDCYQRLEFLGDAILDYLITRHLYEDPRRHSPGALTDLRSALVNNTIFATLAARHGFHKYFRHMSPGLNEVLTKYVRIQEENGHSISEEHYLIQEDELEQAEDVEVPKALGDLFESVAGAIFLDSGMSLGAVWNSYVNLMGAELEAFSAAAPKSPVRELLEAEPDTAKFGKPERLADGRRVRVCVEVFGRGAFKGVGRNYRIAKGTAARCALRHLKRRH